MRPCPTTSMWKLQPYLAIALGVAAPLPHLHEQEQVHLLLEDFGEFLARRLADGTDRLSLVAEHDLLLAVALDIDHLLDPHGAVLAFLPFLGLDMRGVRKLLMQPEIELL